jgi:hypothetical protein
VCTAEGVNVTANGTFTCYNASNNKAPTQVIANDKAVANGCFGSHAMGGKAVAHHHHPVPETRFVLRVNTKAKS